MPHHETTYQHIPIDREPFPFDWRWWLAEKALMGVVVLLGAVAILIWLPIALLLSLPQALASSRRARREARPPAHKWPPFEGEDVLHDISRWPDEDRPRSVASMPTRFPSVFDAPKPEPAKMFPHKR